MIETPRDITALAARAFAVHRDICHIRQQADRLMLALGQLLRQVRDDELWRPLEYESFAAYLADPDIGLSHSAAYRAIAVAEGFQRHLSASPPGTPGVDPNDIAALGTHKAALLAPVVADASDTETAEWVAKGLTLTTSDLRREIRRSRGTDTETAAFLDQLSHQLAALARQLPDSRDPAAVLDSIADRCVAARARLEQEAER